MTRFAGDGNPGYGGDGGPAVDAQIGYLTSLAVDDQGALLIADPQNSRVRRVTPDGVINTFVEKDSVISIAAGTRGDRGARRMLALPSALQSRPEPDRAGLRQTKSNAARQGAANRRRSLEGARRPCLMLLARRMRQLSPSRRVFLVILKML